MREDQRKDGSAGARGARASSQRMAGVPSDLLPHTAESGEVINGARTRMSRKPAALARELLRNFPKGGKGRRGQRRRKKGKGGESQRSRPWGRRRRSRRGRPRGPAGGRGPRAAGAREPSAMPIRIARLWWPRRRRLRKTRARPRRSRSRSALRASAPRSRSTPRSRLPRRPPPRCLDRRCDGRGCWGLRHWHRVWYRCQACGLVWSPNLLSGRRRRGWWRCPNGCNG